MKKNQREVYQVLANEADFTMCGFCKFAESSGDCCDGDIDCKHPLNGKSWGFDHEVDCANTMGDCWGFRPAHDVSFCADIIGIILSQGWTGGASWWQDKEGNWKIAGINK